MPDYLVPTTVFWRVFPCLFGFIRVLYFVVLCVSKFFLSVERYCYLFYSGTSNIVLYYTVAKFLIPVVLHL